MPDSALKEISKLSNWKNAITASADPERARHFLSLLASTEAGLPLEEASKERARILIALFDGSRALSDWLISHPQFIKIVEPEALKFPRRKQGLRQELGQSFTPLLSRQDFGAALSSVRQ